MMESTIPRSFMQSLLLADYWIKFTSYEHSQTHQVPLNYLLPECCHCHIDWRVVSDLGLPFNSNKRRAHSRFLDSALANSGRFWFDDPVYHSGNILPHFPGHKSQKAEALGSHGYPGLQFPDHTFQSDKPADGGGKFFLPIPCPGLCCLGADKARDQRSFSILAKDISSWQAGINPEIK